MSTNGRRCVSLRSWGSHVRIVPGASRRASQPLAQQAERAAYDLALQRLALPRAEEVGERVARRLRPLGASARLRLLGRGRLVDARGELLGRALLLEPRAVLR